MVVLTTIATGYCALSALIQISMAPAWKVVCAAAFEAASVAVN